MKSAFLSELAAVTEKHGFEIIGIDDAVDYEDKNRIVVTARMILREIERDGTFTLTDDQLPAWTRHHVL